MQDTTGRVQIRSKKTADVKHWSKPFYIFKKHPSGFKLSDLQKTKTVVKHHTEEEIEEVRRGMKLF